MASAGKNKKMDSDEIFAILMIYGWEGNGDA